MVRRGDFAHIACAKTQVCQKGRGVASERVKRNNYILWLCACALARGRPQWGRRRGQSVKSQKKCAKPTAKS